MFDIAVKEEFNILESLLEYINEIHENIGKIDNNSSIYNRFDNIYVDD